MTEPGNISQNLPPGRDWIPRKFADIDRKLKKHGAALSTGGANVVTGTQADDTGTSITSTVAGSGTSSVSGDRGIAIGDNAQAGYRAVAIGGAPDGARAVGDTSVAVGSDCEATGDEAVTIGHLAVATGDDSVAIGGGAQAEEVGAIAIGNRADAFNVDAIAIGDLAEAGTSGVAVGDNTNAAIHGTAIGSGAQAGAAGTVAIGCDSSGTPAAAATTNEFALGTANHIVIIDGKLVIRDSSLAYWQIVVSTGGALSTVAYP